MTRDYPKLKARHAKRVIEFRVFFGDEFRAAGAISIGHSIIVTKDFYGQIVGEPPPFGGSTWFVKRLRDILTDIVRTKRMYEVKEISPALVEYMTKIGKRELLSD